MGYGAYDVLLIVMFEAGTWRVKPAEKFTFGRAPACSLVLPGNDRGVSRRAGSFECDGSSWWLRNDSASSMLYLAGDRGFRADLPSGMRVPLQQWHAKVRLDGLLGSYTIRLRLPHLDDDPDRGELDEPGEAAAEQAGQVTSERVLTSTKLRAPLSDTDRLVLAARFEEYLTWRHSGAAQPRSARETADRIGWQAHTVTKRCENIRNRYVRIGVPGLRGPRALEELAALLISTGELTDEDLRRLPPKPAATPPPKPPATPPPGESAPARRPASPPATPPPGESAPARRPASPPGS
jgi:predicted component of type VI protein secretion system